MKRRRKEPSGACLMAAFIFSGAGVLLAFMGSLLSIVPLLIGDILWRIA